jgi:hypothetical protein
MRLMDLSICVLPVVEAVTGVAVALVVCFMEL